jgi:hypothetical protein
MTSVLSAAHFHDEELMALVERGAAPARSSPSTARADEALKGVSGKRLTYRTATY